MPNMKLMTGQSDVTGDRRNIGFASKINQDQPNRSSRSRIAPDADTGGTCGNFHLQDLLRRLRERRAASVAHWLSSWRLAGATSRSPTWTKPDWSRLRKISSKNMGGEPRSAASMWRIH